MSANRILFPLAVVAATLCLLSCSTTTTEQAPAKGTPAFYWQAAKERFKIEDYVKTQEHLDRVLATENEYTARARTWQLLLTAGMAKGYSEVADTFEVGGKATKTDSVSFRRVTSTSRNAAGRLYLRFGEVLGDLLKTKDETLPVGIPYPSGSLTKPIDLAQAGRGVSLTEEGIEAAQHKAVTWGILSVTCKAVGAAEDTAKATGIFSSGDVRVPRATFMKAMAAAAYDAMDLYKPAKLDDPSKIKLFGQQATGALKGVPADKETRDLTNKVQTAVRKAR